MTTLISAGNIVSAVTVSGGETVLDSGTVVTAWVSGGGTLEIAAGGLASTVSTLSGGETLVDGGGVLSGGTVASGATLSLAAGAVADSLTVAAGGTVTGTGEMAGYSDVAGTLISTTIGDNGTRDSYAVVQLDAGGVASAVTIVRGGMGVLAGAFASGTTLTGGDYTFLDVAGSAVGTVVTANSAEYVLSGGTTTSSLVSGYGAVEVVSSGGMASNVTVAGYQASMVISAGGVASGAVVSSGASYAFSPVT